MCAVAEREFLHRSNHRLEGNYEKIWFMVRWKKRLYIFQQNNKKKYNDGDCQEVWSKKKKVFLHVVEKPKTQDNNIRKIKEKKITEKSSSDFE